MATLASQMATNTPQMATNTQRMANLATQMATNTLNRRGNRSKVISEADEYVPGPSRLCRRLTLCSYMASTTLNTFSYFF